MLEHGSLSSIRPERVVVLGAGGVLGQALQDGLNEDGLEFLALGSSDIDLLAGDAAARLAETLRPTDSVVMLAALTPDKGRDIATFMKNLVMAETVCGALKARPVQHVLYMSSDAVYPMTSGLVSEETPATPPDLYGTMHYAREIMFRESVQDCPLAILRCTLVVSSRDTHNSYGPNRFRRQAEDGKIIGLGGEGEETRDHIADHDVARLVGLVLAHRSRGLLNLATGSSHSFKEVADMVASNFSPQATVQGSPRQSPITHRRFDVTALHQAFPRFSFTPLADAIAGCHRQARISAG